jgi:hypothetical protein
MYSFAQRSDISVVDEPLYGHYLRVTGAQHPAHHEVMASMNCDGDRVIRALMKQQTSEPSPILFLKHMAHHLVDLDLGFLRKTTNIFLIRDPRDMLPSLTVQLPHAGLQDTGLKRQWQLFEELTTAGQTPAILDSRLLLSDPAVILQQLCKHLGLDFDTSMLRWEAGARPEDGIWAPHWYHAVHESTGFAPYRPKDDFPEALLGLLRKCQPWYERLFEHALGNNSKGE